MFPQKRFLSPSPPPQKKAKVEENIEECAFCLFTKEQTKDEGDLHKFRFREKIVYVHETCLLYSGRTSSEEPDQGIVTRVLTRPYDYKCKAEPCACKKPTGATIGCCIKKCRQVYHYRCALTMGTMLPTGHFYCSKHIGDAEDIIEDLKAQINWPSEVPYMFENDWSQISPEDVKLIASSTTGWDTWADIHRPIVKIVKVAPSHWAWTENMPYDLQATENIRADEAICEIVGTLRKVDKHWENVDHYTDVYLPKHENKFMSTFTENNTKRLVIDSSKSGNEGRYVNFLTSKAKELGLTPNCHVLTVWSMGRLKDVLIALTDIHEGESIILDDASVFQLESDENNNNTNNNDNNNNNVNINNNTNNINKTLRHKILNNQIPTHNININYMKEKNYIPCFEGNDGLDSDNDENDDYGSSLGLFGLEHEDIFNPSLSPPLSPLASQLDLPSKKTPESNKTPTYNNNLPANNAPTYNNNLPANNAPTYNNNLPATNAPTYNNNLPANNNEDEFLPVTIDHTNNTTFIQKITPRPSRPPSSGPPPLPPPPIPIIRTHSYKNSSSAHSPPSSSPLSSSQSNSTKPHTYNTRASSPPTTRDTNNNENKNENKNETTNGNSNTPKSGKSHTTLSKSTFSTPTNKLKESSQTPPHSNGKKSSKANSRSKTPNKNENSNTTNNNSTTNNHNETNNNNNNNNNNETTNNNNDNKENGNNNTNSNNVSKSIIKMNYSSDNLNSHSNSNSQPLVTDIETGRRNSVLDPIDERIHKINTTYGVDIMGDLSIDMDIPLRFFYMLKKLEAECTCALQKEMQDHQYQVTIAKDIQQLIAKRLESAPTPETKEKLKQEFAAIESELVKKEQNVLIEELTTRQKQLRNSLKIAVEVVETLHADIKVATD